jgi:hypothetical protein
MWSHLSSTTRVPLFAGILFACSPVWAQDGEDGDAAVDAAFLDVGPDSVFVGQLLHPEDEEEDAGGMPSVHLPGYKADEFGDPDGEETRSGSDHVDRDTGELSGGAVGCSTQGTPPQWLFALLMLHLVRRKR